MPEIAAMKLQCDLVMRGGIASGLVYPRAIAKLAETYDFRSIGGTSVGAIASAGTAAAALGTFWNNGGDIEKERDIELVLMTTNITRGISHRFPFLEGSWGKVVLQEN